LPTEQRSDETQQPARQSIKAIDQPHEPANIAASGQQLCASAERYRQLHVRAPDG
jgi:hypothetical protein